MSLKLQCTTFELYDKAINAFIAQSPHIKLGDDLKGLNGYAYDGVTSLVEPLEKNFVQVIPSTYMMGYSVKNDSILLMNMCNPIKKQDRQLYLYRYQPGNIWSLSPNDWEGQLDIDCHFFVRFAIGY